MVSEGNEGVDIADAARSDANPHVPGPGRLSSTGWQGFEPFKARRLESPHGWYRADQRPFQLGLRFSAKALGPSIVSSLRVMATNAG